MLAVHLLGGAGPQPVLAPAILGMPAPAIASLALGVAFLPAARASRHAARLRNGAAAVSMALGLASIVLPVSAGAGILAASPLAAAAMVLAGAAASAIGRPRLAPLAPGAVAAAGVLALSGAAGHLIEPPGVEAEAGISIPLVPAALLGLAAAAIAGPALAHAPGDAGAGSRPARALRLYAAVTLVVPAIVGGATAAAVERLGVTVSAALAGSTLAGVALLAGVSLVTLRVLGRSEAERDDAVRALASRLERERHLIAISSLAAFEEGTAGLIGDALERVVAATGGECAIHASFCPDTGEITVTCRGPRGIRPGDEARLAASLRACSIRLAGASGERHDCEWVRTHGGCPMGDFRGSRESRCAVVEAPHGVCDVLFVAWPEGSVPAGDDPAGFLRSVAGILSAAIGRAAARERHRRIEDRFREIAESLSEVVWVAAADGSRMQYVSPSFDEVFGVSREKVAQDGGAWLERVHPDDRERVREGIPGQRLGAYDEQYRIVRPGGAVRWVRVRATPVPGPGGAAERVIGTVSDVTDLRRAEEELRTTEKQFLQAQKMEAVGRLAGGVAHDFNNLLTVIHGYGEMLRAGLPAEDRRRKFVDEVLLAAERAANLTGQLLAFSRQQVTRAEPLDLNGVVEGASGMLSRLIGEDIEIAFEPDRTIGCVVADRTEMEQVILNLAVNARDAMPRGGRLRIATSRAAPEPAEIAAAGAAPGGDWVELSVADTGVGMSAEVLAHAFEPFFTTKEPGKGTGLGLATVYGIVRHSGGVVRLQSEPWKGTTVRIFLPFTVAGEPCPGEDPATTRGGTERILLVEDDEAVRKLAASMLTDAGYAVTTAGNSDAALGSLRAHDCDLLVTDVVLPGIPGPALAARGREMRPGLRVLFCSGYTAGMLPDAVREAVGAAFVRKPFDRSSLLRAVRARLDAPRPAGDAGPAGAPARPAGPGAVAERDEVRRPAPEPA